MTNSAQGTVTVALTPGTCGLAYDVSTLVGADRVGGQGWGTPVTVVEVTPEELAFLRELYEPQGIKVRVQR